MTDKGFIKFNRGDNSKELLKSRNSFVLLALIACRTKRTDDLSIEGLEVGEALIGDFKACGLTRQEHRTALNNLKKWEFITTKITNKGTIVKLIDARVFNINKELINHQATIKQPSNKNGRMEEKNNASPLGSSHYSNKVGGYLETINAISKELLHIEEVKKQKFNPYQFIQVAANNGSHPAAIIDALKSIKLGESIKNIWSYANAILKTLSQNYREAEHLEEMAEFRKVLSVPGGMEKLINETFKNS